jgi:tRNA dimethylallyltransferase
MKVIVVVGPTSSGKTKLALDLCQKFNGEVISADSRQVVRHMDIGTGKQPIGADLKVVKSDKKWILNKTNVWGYDLCDPSEFFSAYDFALFARKKTLDLLSKGKVVFIVGGTGFYIDVVTGKTNVSHVIPNLDLRNELNSSPLADLVSQLKSLNPLQYEKIDLNNKVRVIRSLEKSLNSGRTEAPLPDISNVEFSFIGLTAPRNVLYEKADVWVESIWNSGLVDEVKNLMSLGYSNSPKLQGLVYREVMSYLRGEITMEQAIQLIKFSLHAYIRRQQTWFKTNKSISWFDITEPDYRKKAFDLVELMHR